MRVETAPSRAGYGRQAATLLAVLLSGCVAPNLPAPDSGTVHGPLPAPSVTVPGPGASDAAIRAYTTPPPAPQDPARMPIESARGSEAEALARALLPQLEAMRRVASDSGGVLRVDTASETSVSLVVEAPGLLNDVERSELAQGRELPSAREAAIVMVDRLLEGARRGTLVSVRMVHSATGQLLASYRAEER